MTRHKARRARTYSPRKAKQPSESSIQSAFIRGLQHIPHPAATTCHYAIPNQAIGPRPARQAKFGNEGCRWGACDWHMFYPTKKHPGLYIEFKRPGEKPRANQVEFMATAEACGHRVEVCHSAVEGWRVVCEYLGVDVPDALKDG